MYETYILTVSSVSSCQDELSDTTRGMHDPPVISHLHHDANTNSGTHLHTHTSAANHTVSAQPSRQTVQAEDNSVSSCPHVSIALPCHNSTGAMLCIRVYVCPCVYIYMYTYIHVYMHVMNTYVRLHTKCMYLQYIYKHRHKCKCKFMHVFMYGMYLCMHAPNQNKHVTQRLRSKEYATISSKVAHAEHQHEKMSCALT